MFVFQKVIKAIIIIAASLLIIGWLGFLIQPKNFAIDAESMQKQKLSINGKNIPPSLQIYADKVFLQNGNDIKTSVIWGKVKINVKGLWMPARFVTYYVLGEGFFRYMEITWFGMPIVSGYDLYSDGKTEFCMADQIETGEKIKQGQNLALWAETIWSPTAYFKDDDIEWESIGENKVKLTVPYEENSDEIIFYINPDSGLVDSMEALRYKGQSEEKVPWQIDLIEWGEYDGVLIPGESSVKWADEKKPWSYWSIEGVLYNIEISDGFDEEMQKYIDGRR